MIWLLLLLIVLIATGAFWLVLKIALGVALGVFLGLLAIVAFVMWRVRKAMTPPKGTTGPNGSSQITIDYRPDYRPDYDPD
jgi:membrane protein implicated in regulation of membrane protease activity